MADVFQEIANSIANGFKVILNSSISELGKCLGEFVSDINNFANNIELMGAGVGVLMNTYQKVGDNLADVIDDVDQTLIKDASGSPGELTKTISTLNQTLGNVNDLFVIYRGAPRAESELLPHELSAIQSLNRSIATIEHEIGILSDKKKHVIRNIKTLTIPDYPPEENPSEEPSENPSTGPCEDPYHEPYDGHTSVPLKVSNSEPERPHGKLKGKDGEDEIEHIPLDSLYTVDLCKHLFEEYHYPYMNVVYSYCNELRYLINRINHLTVKRLSLISEKDYILCTQPGIIPNTLNNVNEIVDRFNCIEQPKIEDILDSIDDGAEETVGILKQAQKLFVETKLEPKTDLSPIDKNYLKWLEAKKSALEDMALKEYTLSDKLFTSIKQTSPTLAIPAEGDQ